jgi:hypothetical protein
LLNYGFRKGRKCLPTKPPSSQGFFRPNQPIMAWGGRGHTTSDKNHTPYFNETPNHFLHRKKVKELRDRR